MREMFLMLCVTPIPISACFKNVRGRGRVASKRYTAWKSDVDRQIAQRRVVLRCQDVPAVWGSVEVVITAYLDDNRARDLDNMLKAINDSLVRNGIISDDSAIVSLSITKKVVPKGRAAIEITVKALDI